jgi:putative ABC transport system permease protein
MFSNNMKLAMQSLKAAKWRSFLTMLGVIIGVFSVVSIVSIGVGIRQQITNQIKQLGADLITVLPGENISTSPSSLLKQVSILPQLGTGSLNQSDLTLVGSTPGVNVAVPMSTITGTVSIDGNNYNNAQVIATTSDFPSIVNKNVQYGQFFQNGDIDPNEAIVGQNVAIQLFKENIPIGKSFQIRDRTFTVEGVFGQFNTSPLSPISDYNNTIFIPYNIGQSMSGNQTQIYEIFAKPNHVDQTSQVASAVNTRLLKAHGGQNNFTVLEQKQNLAIANNTLNTLTALIAAVAAVSLVVGGIGIMNIMLVSVMERTREIGVRKAVGGTNRQILTQFLIEAAMLSLTGGIIGVILSLLADIIIRYYTTLQPTITLPIVLLALGISLLAGVLFGAMPAFKAARKDPVDSLRHE